MSAEKHQAVQPSKMCLACNKEYAGEMQFCPDDKTALIAIGREDPYLGKVLADRFEINDIIGKGGMGVVYLAKHQVLDRLVAIKMLQAELTQDEASVKRFQQEAKAASHLNHPHLITLHDFGVTPTQQPFLVMEYLEGRSLLDVLREEGPMEPKRAVKIFSEAADGLHHAHTVGILHRDLKPSNILLINHQGDRDFVKIVDFGLAKLMPWSGKESQHLTKTGEVFGSPIYMSPEQCMGKELRPTSDIYSLGITLFECLTGKPPFRGTNSIQTASKHMTEIPPTFREVRPDLPLPEGLEKVVMKCLAKNTQDRFQNMADFKDALIAGLNTEQVELPASLMVSTRAIPAVSAQMAAAQSAVRKAVQPAPEPRPEPKKPPYAAIFGGIGALALAGIAAFCFFPVPGEASGNISYYELNEKGGLVHVKSADTLRVFNIGSEVPAMMSDNASQNCLGSTVTVQYNHSRFESADTGTITRLAFKPTGKPDEEPKAAVSAVDDFLNDVALNWQSRINEMYGSELGKQFQDDNQISWKFIPTSKKSGRSFHQSLVGATSGSTTAPKSDDKDSDKQPPARKGDIEYEFESRPAHAYKLMKTSRDEYRVLVDGFSFTTQDPAPFWQFDVKMDGDTAKITNYEKIDQAVWDKL